MPTTLPPFSKQELLFLLAFKASTPGDDDLDAQAFVQRAFAAVVDVMRRTPAILASEVDSWVAHARGGADTRTLYEETMRLAAALPEADYRAALRGVIDQDVSWLLRASHAPATRVQ